MDADTLAEANVIEGDKPRMKAAQQKAGSMAEDKQEEASAMKQVAKPGSGGSSNGPSKSSSTKKPTAKAAVNSLTSGIPGVGGRRR
jgi:hypothetical protein